MVKFIIRFILMTFISVGILGWNAIKTEFIIRYGDKIVLEAHIIDEQENILKKDYVTLAFSIEKLPKVSFDSINSSSGLCYLVFTSSDHNNFAEVLHVSEHEPAYGIYIPAYVLAVIDDVIALDVGSHLKRYYIDQSEKLELKPRLIVEAYVWKGHVVLVSVQSTTLT